MKTMQTIKAVYEKGIIKPLEPVPFEAKQMVLITFHNEETDKDFNISNLTTNETIPKRQPINKEKAEMALEALYGCAKGEKLTEKLLNERRRDGKRE